MRATLRPLALFALFCLLPAALASAAASAWFSIRQERLEEIANHEMERLLKELRDDLLLERDRVRIAAECRARLEELPRLDEAGVAAVRERFERATPGLLKLVVYSVEGTAEGTLALRAAPEAKFRSAFAMLGEWLAASAGLRPARAAGAREELARRTLLGNQVTLQGFAAGRGELFEIVHDGRPSIVFWDVVPGGRDRPGRGVLLCLIDREAFREVHYRPAALIARAAAAAKEAGVELAGFSLDSATGEARLARDCPPLAERAARGVRGVAFARERDALHALAFVRDADRFVLHARKPLSACFPEVNRDRLLVRALLAGWVFVFLAGLALVQSGAVDLPVPIRVQVAGLFFVAGVMPLALAGWLGFRFVAANREVRVKRAAETLRERVLGCEELASVEKRALYRLSDQLRAGEASEAVGRWLELARARGVEPQAVATAEVVALFATLEIRIGELIDRGVVTDCFVYDGTGRQVFRRRLESEKFRMMESEVYNRVSEHIIHYMNTGLMDLPAERRGDGNDFIGRVFLATGGRKEVLEGLIRNRGVIHSIDLFEYKASMYFEPILEAGRKAVAAMIVVYDMRRRMREVAASTVRASHGEAGGGARLFAADLANPAVRHPSAEAFAGDLEELVRRVAAERQAVETVVSHGGAWTLAYAAPMREMSGIAMIGLLPLYELDRAHARDLRLLSAAFAVALLFALAASLLLSRRLLAPLSLLAAGIARVREGDLTVRIETGTRDEFGALASTLNDTLARLAATLRDLAASNDDLARSNVSLDRRLKELQVLHDVSQKMHILTELDELLKVILDRVIEVFDAHHASILLLSPDGSELELRAIRGVEPPARRIMLRPDEGIAGLVLAQGRAHLVNEASEDGRFKPLEYSHERRRMKSLLCAPLVIGKRVAGVMNVVDRLSGDRVFDAEDAKLLESIAGQLALTIEIFELHRDLLDNERVVKELEIARSIQSRLFPARPPDLPGYSIDHHNEPAREVGGDYYDHLPIPDGSTGFAIADVSGKGVPAALIMVMVRSILRVEAVAAEGPEQFVARLNDHVGQLVEQGRFVTFLYGLLDPVAHRFRYANAGHNYPLHYHAADGRVTEMEGGGLILGVMGGISYDRFEVELSPGDALLFYTDGVTEAQNAGGELFGEARLAELFATIARLPAAGIRAGVEEAVRLFEAGAPRADDITLIVIKREA